MRVGSLKMAILASLVHCLPNIFSARQHAERAICYRKSVCPSVWQSVCPSVPLSVTRVNQSKRVEVRIMQFSPYSSAIPVSIYPYPYIRI